MNKLIQKASFDIGAFVQKAFRNEDGDMIVIAKASDSDVDLVNDIMTEKAIEGMVEQAKKGINILCSHKDTFEIGKTIDGEIRKINGLCEYIVHIKLDERFPESHVLFDEVNSEKGTEKQLSIGGFINLDNPKAYQIVERDGMLVREIDDIQLEHIALTRKDFAANPRTGFVGVIAKSLDQFIEKQKIKIGAVPFKSYELAPKNMKWSWDKSKDPQEILLWGSGAKDMEEFEGLPDDQKRVGWQAVKNAHAIWMFEGQSKFPNIPNSFDAYKLAHHKLIDGDLMTVLDGVEKSLERLNSDEFKGLPEEIKEEALKHLRMHIEESQDIDDVFEENSLHKQKMKFKDGDFVKWNSSGGEAKGKIVSIHTKGEVPDIDAKVTGSEEDPAARIQVYKELESNLWEPTDVFVGHKFSALKGVKDIKVKKDIDCALLEKETVTFKSFPLSKPDQDWRFDAEDGDAILLKGSGADSMEEFANMDPQEQEEGWKLFKQAHTYFDPQEDPEHKSVPHEKQAYALPHHKLIGGRLTTVQRGVIFAASSINGARGGFRRVSSDSERKKLYDHLRRHAREFNIKLPDLRPFSEIGKNDRDYMEEFKSFMETQNVDMGWFDNQVLKYYSDYGEDMDNRTIAKAIQDAVKNMVVKMKPMDENGKKLKKDDFVKWKSGGGWEVGRIVSIYTDGKVPNFDTKMTCDEDEPAARIRVYKKCEEDMYEPTGKYVTHMCGKLHKMEPPKVKEDFYETNKSTYESSSFINNSLTFYDAIDVVEKEIKSRKEKGSVPKRMVGCLLDVIELYKESTGNSCYFVNEDNRLDVIKSMSNDLTEQEIQDLKSVLGGMFSLAEELGMTKEKEIVESKEDSGDEKEVEKDSEKSSNLIKMIREAVREELKSSVEKDISSLSEKVVQIEKGMGKKKSLEGQEDFSKEEEKVEKNSLSDNWLYGKYKAFAQ